MGSVYKEMMRKTPKQQNSQCSSLDIYIIISHWVWLHVNSLSTMHGTYNIELRKIFEPSRREVTAITFFAICTLHLVLLLWWNKITNNTNFMFCWPCIPVWSCE